MLKVSACIYFNHLITVSGAKKRWLPYNRLWLQKRNEAERAYIAQTKVPSPTAKMRNAKREIGPKVQSPIRITVTV